MRHFKEQRFKQKFIVNINSISALILLLLSFSVVQSQNRISVHCHCPEGKEIGSIIKVNTELMTNTNLPNNWNPPVHISLSKDGQTWILVDHGSTMAGNHPRKIVTTADIKYVKVEFNGMILIQDVDLVIEPEKTLVFEFTSVMSCL